MLVEKLLLFLVAVSVKATYSSSSSGEHVHQHKTGLRSKIEDRREHPLIDQISTRVIGGNEVSPKFNYPWMARIVHVTYGTWCGASLVHPSYILTSAHCQHIYSPDVFTVEIHRHNITRPPRDEEAIVVDVAEILNHPDYGEVTGNDHDVSLWKLSSPVERDDIEYASIDMGNYFGLGMDATIIGWGYLGYDSEVSETLQEARVSIVDCNLETRYHIVPDVSFDNDSEFCAGVREDNRRAADACNGDSGGPIFDKMSGVQIGVISWGIGCGFEGFPGVYSKLSDEGIRRFLDSVIQLQYDDETTHEDSTREDSTREESPPSAQRNGGSDRMPDSPVNPQNPNPGSGHHTDSPAAESSDPPNEQPQFLYYTQPISWLAAVAMCPNGTGLASIHSAEEQEIVAQLCGGQTCWIGIRNDQQISDDQWSWRDGSELNFTNWLHQSHHSPQNRCGFVNPDGLWDELNCIMELPFVCREIGVDT